MTQSQSKPKSATPRKDSEETQVHMTFGEHLEELRKRIVYSLLGSITFIGICMYYAKPIGYFLIRPYVHALEAHGYTAAFQYSRPAEALVSYLGLGFKVGLIIASPWIIYQVWLFVAAGLYRKERLIVYKYIGPSIILFFCGVAFFYFLVLPLALNFFVGYSDDTAMVSPSATTTAAASGPATQSNLLPIPLLDADPPPPPDGTGFFYFNKPEHRLKFRTPDKTWSVMVIPDGSLFMNTPNFDFYLNFLAMTALVFGLAFEMPMVILVLAQIGIVEVHTFRNIRKYAYLAIAVLSALAAPTTDPWTMLSLMFPLIGLYEIGIIAAAIVVRRQNKEGEDEPVEDS